MERTRSADGTSIAFTRSGRGAPLLVVGGGLSDHTAATPLLPHLEPHLTVHVVDRRGRGESGDTPPYAVDREVEDVAAVLEAIGAPAHVYGHSSGALLALEAALRGLPIRRLALYEPPYIVDDQRPRPSADWADRVEERVRQGDGEGALRTFLREGPGLPDAAIDQARATPVWAAWLAMARTVAHDARLSGQCVLPGERVARLGLPVLVLQGGASPGWMRSGTEALARALPEGELVTLAGQEHAAAQSAPELVARELLRFLDPRDSS